MHTRFFYEFILFLLLILITIKSEKSNKIMFHADLTHVLFNNNERVLRSLFKTSKRRWFKVKMLNEQFIFEMLRAISFYNSLNIRIRVKLLSEFSHMLRKLLLSKFSHMLGKLIFYRIQLSK